MKHLLRSQVKSFFKIIPYRYSFLRFPKTKPFPDLNDDLLHRFESQQDLTPLLHDWRQRGYQVELSELRAIVSSLRTFNRFSHALQVSEWMSEQKVYSLSSVDMETQFLLIAKVRGLEEAEKFFETIPVNMRDSNVYNALLTCYKTNKSLSKAEATFQKMRKLGFTAKSSSSYNAMLYLYNQAENHHMVVEVLREMEKNNMEPEGVSICELLVSYAAVSDIKGMERFEKKWKGKPGAMPGWHACVLQGMTYLDAGSEEKALAMLRRSEPLVKVRFRERVYEHLMIVYGRKGKREDVKRLWNLCKDMKVFDIFGYTLTIRAFMRKGDVEGAYKVLEEWDTGEHRHFNVELSQLLKFGILNKRVMLSAERIVNTLAEINDEDSAAWHKLKANKENKAEGEMWKPKNLALSAYACTQYLEGRRDIDSTAGVLRLLSKQEPYPMDENRMSRKIVEAMRGGGYIGGVEEE